MTLSLIRINKSFFLAGEIVSLELYKLINVGVDRYNDRHFPSSRVNSHKWFIFKETVFILDNVC